jgi:hypothetical protein
MTSLDYIDLRECGARDLVYLHHAAVAAGFTENATAIEQEQERRLVRKQTVLVRKVR